MRVCFVGVDDACKVKHGARSLEIGREYIVLSIQMNPNGHYYRLAVPSYDNARGSALFFGAWFKIRDPTIPSSWIVHQSGDGSIDLVPRAWAKDHFFEDYYDGDPEMHRLYNAEFDLLTEDRSLNG